MWRVISFRILVVSRENKEASERSSNGVEGTHVTQYLLFIPKGDILSLRRKNNLRAKEITLADFFRVLSRSDLTYK